ncbi:MAG: hypothetical protein PHP88_02550 [bacterium]|nr:hypothetical protein [bacterium]
MGTTVKRILVLAVGLLLAAGIPYVVATSVHAGPASGSECESPCGGKADCGHGKECANKDCKQKAGGPPMREGMARHLEEMRGTIAKLRALEAKMEALKPKDDAAAFRTASLEHSKLLTDLQASHLNHMEGMMGK